MNKFNSTQPQWKEQENVLTLEETSDIRQLILFNDDVNTFDHVIEMLVKYCDHDPHQAEQCAFIVHHNGKCDIKSGSYEDLEPVCTALLESGLSAEIH